MTQTKNEKYNRYKSCKALEKYESLKKELYQGDYKEIRKLLGSKEDIKNFAKEMEGFPEGKEELIKWIDIYLNSNFIRSFDLTIVGAAWAFITVAMNDVVKNMIRTIRMLFTNQETSEHIISLLTLPAMRTVLMFFKIQDSSEYTISFFTFIAMAGIMYVFCFGMFKIRNKSLNLKRDLLLLKSLLKDRNPRQTRKLKIKIYKKYKKGNPR